MFCPNAIVFGDLATWVGGGATALTLMFLVYQWWQHWRTEQARQIYSWLSREGHYPVELRVGNNSGVPVYDVYLYYAVMPDTPGLHTWEKVEDTFDNERAKGRVRGNFDHRLPGLALIQVLPPGVFRVDKQLMFLTGGSPRIDASRMSGVDLVFTDTSGRRWTRRARGKLGRTRKDPKQRRRMTEVFTTPMIRGWPYSRVEPVSEDRATSQPSPPEEGNVSK
jgi:hypothetical protein